MSLEKTEYKNFHVIVVDNGSTDKSASLIEKKYPGITLLKSERNLGFSGGNNLGIRYALDHDAEYIWILNNDTRVEKDTLPIMVNKMVDDSDIGIAGCTIRFDKPPHNIQLIGGGRLHRWSARLQANLQEKGFPKLDYITGCSMFVRSEVFKGIGFLNETMFFYWEDVDFTRRVKDAGYQVAYFPDAMIYHAGNASGQGGTEWGDYYFSHGTVTYYKNHIHYWLLLLALAYAGKIIIRSGKGEWGKIRAVTKGFFDGLRSAKPKY